jgi:hypothetical protein
MIRRRSVNEVANSERQPEAINAARETILSRSLRATDPIRSHTPLSYSWGLPGR